MERRGELAVHDQGRGVGASRVSSDVFEILKSVTAKNLPREIAQMCTTRT